MSALRNTLQAAITAALADGPTRIGEVVDRAYADAPEVFADESQQLVMASARRVVKQMLAAMVDDDGAQQLTLTGLPSAIAVRDPHGDVAYVRTDLATWADVEAGFEERNRNVVRAQAKRERYRDAMDRLRPLMADRPDVTVGAAIAEQPA